MAKNYWMVVQKPDDFEITRELGFTVHGMKGRQRRRAQRMEPDDNILFYVSGIKKWTAIAAITSRYYEDPTPIWNPADRGREVYPYRVKLRPQIVMAEDLYIDARALAFRLDYVKRWPAERWPLAFMDTLHLLPQKDFRLIEAEMKRIHPDWRSRPRRRSRKRNRRRQPQPTNGANGSRHFGESRNAVAGE